MNADDLRHERVNLFKDTITGNDPFRVPYYANLWTWKFIDAGFGFHETLYDYAINEKVVRHTVETYKMDVLAECGWRNPVQVTDALGVSEYNIDEEKKIINIPDQCLMEEDDYDALIADPKKYLWETYLPRKCKYLQNTPNSDVFRNFLGKYGEFGAAIGGVAGMLEHEYGIADLTPPFKAFDHWGHGLELLFNSLRGIKGLSMDIRRRPEQVEAAIEALNETFLYPRIERAKKIVTKGTDPEFCVDINPVLFAHIGFSTKQFERFYWPYLKLISDYVVENDKLVYVFAEGLSDRFYDFFRELPANRFVLHLEQDDIFEAKKALPNVTIAGGMPYEVLGSGTPAECVDYVKMLIDKLGYDKHYIFSEDKMISFKEDCRAENLKAVTDFIYDFRY
ncbi:MAG: hypothetical protein FWD72_00870 [Eggerthellaceae bacterium]|nr:hypothetical protein [Eggerthellaceae bacterium]